MGKAFTKPATHGVSPGLYNAGCRCALCRDMNRLRHLKLRTGRAVTHGTESGYFNYACRCTACSKAGSIKNKRDHEARKRRTHGS